jgi:hypothetical protein
MKKAKKETIIHFYLRQPASRVTVVRDNKENILQVQSISIPDDSYRVIYDDKTTIVIMNDGSMGTAHCDEEDTYSRQRGHDIASYRTKIESLKKHLKKLCE